MMRVDIKRQGRELLKVEGIRCTGIKDGTIGVCAVWNCKDVGVEALRNV